MEYWTIIDDRHAGPFTAAQLMDRGLTPETPVWHAGLPDWVAAGEIDELRILLEQAAPQQPEQPEQYQSTQSSQGYQPEQHQSSQSYQPEQHQSNQSYQSLQQPEQQGYQPEQHQSIQGYQSSQQPEPQGYQPEQYQSSQSYQSTPSPQGSPSYQPEPQWDWQRQPAPGEPECPPTYLVWSVIVTVLCCLPFGVAAIICSAQVKQAYKRGNLKKADKMSEAAQWCIILSIVLGLLWIPVQMAFSGLF